MLVYLASFTVLFGAIYGAPLSSCSSQSQCLDLRVTPLGTVDSDGKAQHELCLYFNKDLPECTKDDTISHYCHNRDDDDKEENWQSGEDYGMCNTVSCGGYTTFGVKDGSKCVGDYSYANFGVAGIPFAMCAPSTSACNAGKNTKGCRWVISGPECEETPETTEDPETTEEAYPADTTEEVDAAETTEEAYPADTTEEVDPDTTEEERMCECADYDGYDEAGCNSCAGCILMVEDACYPMYPPDTAASNVYVRDEATDENTNLNFVIEEESTTDADSTNHGELMKVSIGSVIVSIITYLF